MQVDLVLLSLGGVQRFIGESRSTADVAGASEIIQRLAGHAAWAVHNRLDGAPPPCGLIFPVAPDAPSVTNKIAFLARPGTGPEIARAVAVEAGQDWRAQLERTFDTTDPPDTPGMPDLAWVSVTGPVADGAYHELWEAAQREMVGRRRARVFEPVEISQRKLSAQSPGLPAVTAPRGSLSHEQDEALSAAGWAKRRAGSQRFPSTVSIASSMFRSRLLERAGADSELAAELLVPVRRLTTGHWIGSACTPTARSSGADPRRSGASRQAPRSLGDPREVGRRSAFARVRHHAGRAGRRRRLPSGRCARDSGP